MMQSDGPDGHHRLLEMIAFQAEMAGSERDPADIMALACERAQEITGADGAVIELVEGDELVYAVVTGSLAAHRGQRVERISSLAGLAVLEGQPVRCNEAASDPRVDVHACRRAGIVSMLCVPLLVGGRPIGVLEVSSAEVGAFGEVDVALLRLVGGVVGAALRQAQLINELRSQVTRDPMTGLPNRRHWDEALASALALAARDGRPVSVCMMDIDGFKAVNDTRGHRAGDDLLVEISRCWRAAVRSGELLARVGGDEFGVLVQTPLRDGGAALVARLANALPEGCSASIGVATAETPMTVAELMDRADAAMYAMKGQRHRRTHAEAG